MPVLAASILFVYPSRCRNAPHGYISELVRNLIHIDGQTIRGIANVHPGKVSGAAARISVASCASLDITPWQNVSLAALCRMNRIANAIVKKISLLFSYLVYFDV